MSVHREDLWAATPPDARGFSGLSQGSRDVPSSPKERVEVVVGGVNKRLDAMHDALAVRPVGTARALLLKKIDARSHR